MRLAPPVEPDAPEAHRWLVDELAKPEYTSAAPNAFDRAVQAALDWFFGLFNSLPGVPAPIATLVIVIVAIALIGLALLVFGLPRLRARSRRTVTFDGVELASAPRLRRASHAAAEAANWPLAIEERLRAIIRSLADRDLVSVHPGTTAQGFAHAATSTFSHFADPLHDAAASFDAVRYLGAAGDAASYQRLVELDTALEAATPERHSTEPSVAPR